MLIDRRAGLWVAAANQRTAFARLLSFPLLFWGLDETSPYLFHSGPRRAHVAPMRPTTARLHHRNRMGLVPNLIGLVQAMGEIPRLFPHHPNDRTYIF